MTEEVPQFKVIDKRGSGRSSEAESSNSNSEAKVVTQPKVQVEKPQEVSNSNQASDMGSETVGDVDFTSFVMSLCTQAIIMLGEVPNPETGIVSVNLEAARQTIDILRLIQVKTKGNLSKDEHKLLDELVSSLQMAYVNKIQS